MLYKQYSLHGIPLPSLIQAIARRAFTSDQNKAVEHFTRGNRLVINHYVAGNQRATLTQSKYGERRASGIMNSFNPQVKIFNDTVDVEKKRRIETDINELKDKLGIIDGEFQEKHQVDRVARDRAGQIQQEMVCCNLFC
jgi:hypothetical protein